MVKFAKYTYGLLLTVQMTMTCVPRRRESIFRCSLPSVSLEERKVTCIGCHSRWTDNSAERDRKGGSYELDGSIPDVRSKKEIFWKV
jgi:hypothetical protein